MILIVGFDHEKFGIDISVLWTNGAYSSKHLTIVVKIEFLFLLTRIIIIFWYTHLYFNYAYKVGKGSVVDIESMSCSKLKSVLVNGLFICILCRFMF